MIPGVVEKYSRQTTARQRWVKSGLFLNSSFEGSSSHSPGASAWRRRRKCPSAKWHLCFLGNWYLNCHFFLFLLKWEIDTKEPKRGWQSFVGLQCFRVLWKSKKRKVPKRCNNFITDGLLFSKMCSYVGSIHIYIHVKEIKDYRGLQQQQLGLKRKVSLLSMVNNTNLTC